MKKNVYLTIITIITVLAIVLGVLWRYPADGGLPAMGAYGAQLRRQ